MPRNEEPLDASAAVGIDSDCLDALFGHVPGAIFPTRDPVVIASVERKVAEAHLGVLGVPNVTTRILQELAR